MKKLLVVFVLLMFLVAGCKQEAVTTDETVDAGTEVEATATPEPSTDESQDASSETDAETAQDLVPTALPVDPLNLKFETSDGVELDGELWAPTYTDAPVIVLMHQYPMDHNIEWVAIAPWLQNRGLAQYVRTGGETWADTSWFAPMIEGMDFGVFTFTFRNCLGGCSESSVESREEWILDAVAAIESAASFKTIDASKVVVIGTSIGADAAVEACQRLLDDDEIECVGVVALSPGNFLDNSFEDAVIKLVNNGVPVKCIAAEGDTSSADTCANIEADGYEALITTGAAHGIRLFDPSLPIDLTALIPAWLIDWTLTD